MNETITVSGKVIHIRWRSPEDDATIIAKLDNGIIFKGYMPAVNYGDQVEITGYEHIHKKHGKQIDVESWNFLNPTPEKAELAKTITFLHKELDLKKRGHKIFQRYGVKAKEIILKDPYQIALDGVHGIGFQIIDGIAKKIGIEGHDERRVMGALLHHLLESSRNSGHVFLKWDQLVNETAEWIGTEAEYVEENLIALSKRPSNAIDERPRLLIEGKEGKRLVYDRRLHEAEKACSEHIARIRDDGAAFERTYESFPNASPMLSEVTLSEEQMDAVAAGLTQPITIITGGPGTGKTTIIRNIAKTAKAMNMEVVLCAPTGRAAKRMQETSGLEAATIHRLLEINPTTDEFRRNGESPLFANMVIVDESSMLDVQLASSLFQAVQTGAKLVLVGDANQLPPVGPGCVFRDIIVSESVAVKRLTKNFRQEIGSGLIVKGAQSILRRETPEGGKALTDDLFIIPYKNGKHCVDEIVSLVRDRIPAKFGIQSREVQVIGPVYAGDNGVDAVNLALQSALNGVKGEKQKFLKGDRVIHTKNNYSLEVYNGDVGYVDALYEDELVVDYDGRRVRYTSAELHELELAYAITIHKSQGSEYQAAIVIAQPSRPGFYNRNMLYTAITRGKRLVVVMTPQKDRNMSMILSTREQKRNTLLAQRLKV